MASSEQRFLDYETLACHAGEAIRLMVEGQALDGRIAEVSALNRQPSQDRQPFSLLVITDSSTALPQQMMTLEHEALGQLDLFLVPVGPREGGMAYEAVFA